MDTPQAIIAQIHRREERWIAVYLKGDAQGFADLLTDDFVYSSERGVFNKQQYVENLASGVIEMRGFTNSDVDIRVHGQTAISIGVSTLDASYQGRDISGNDRFTRVWVRDHDTWRAAALHANTIAPTVNS